MGWMYRWTVSVALALPALPAMAYDWADDHHRYTQDPQFNHSKAICAQLKDRKPPSSDYPTAEQRKELKGCKPRDLYYGILGSKKDPVKARLCALSSKQNSGTDFLMMIYANGMGVKRDLDLATHYACTIEGAAAFESKGRVEHLQALKSKPKETFDYCDDITSSYGTSYCAYIRNQISEAKRKARIRQMADKWPEDQRYVFDYLEIMRDNYVEASGFNEIDSSGSLSGYYAIQHRGSLTDAFYTVLDKVTGTGKIPRQSLTHHQATTTLEKNYRRLMKNNGSKYGTVKRDNIAATQPEWESYRDAWINFVKTYYPKVSAEQLDTWLMAQRIAVLQKIY